ncbi:MAG: glycosyltransferase family 1 protein [Methylobacterium sp.]
MTIPPSAAARRAAAAQPRHAITINGRFLAQRTSGVQRYARQILAAMADLVAESPARYADLGFRLALPSDAEGPVPDYLDFARPVAGRKRGYAWEQIELPRAAGLSLNLCNLAPVAARRKVVCIHDVNTYLAPYSYDWKYRAFQRVSVPLLGRTASAVVTVSHSSARSLAAVGAVRDAGAVVVAPNGHEHALAWRADKAALDLDAVTHRPFVVMLGGRAPHKNVGLVRAIAPALAARGIDCVVTGSLDGVFARGGVGDLGPIHAVGHVSDDDIALLFSRAVGLLFPSFVEGFGLPIVEAMARGCPVVSSDRSCMPEICADAAILADPEDPAAWIAAIAGLAGNPDLRADRIAAGRARVAHYSWRTSAQTYLDLLGRLVRSPA